jgi:hypothetical protein
MAKKGKPNRCYHEIYYDILKELEIPHNVTQLRSLFISKEASIEPTPLRRYSTDLLAMGLANIQSVRPRSTKHKFKPRGTTTLKDLGSQYLETNTEGKKYIQHYDELERLLYIPQEDEFASSFTTTIPGHGEGEFLLTPANIAALETILGKDSSKWVGRRFDATVIKVRDKSNNNEYLGWSIVKDSIRQQPANERSPFSEAES